MQGPGKADWQEVFSDGIDTQPKLVKGGNKKHNGNARLLSEISIVTKVRF